MAQSMFQANEEKPDFHFISDSAANVLIAVREASQVALLDEALGVVLASQNQVVNCM
jgi:hypothetical protein